jgi:hypothetical protein
MFSSQYVIIPDRTQADMYISKHYMYRDGFTGGCGGGGGAPPPALAGGGCYFFMIKQKIIRDKMRYSNLSNNKMISKL